MRKMENNVVDLAESEIMGIIEENAMLKSALQKATAAFLYANGARDESLPDWDSLPEGSYAIEGGIRSGRSTYMAQAAETANWLKYWAMM
jgi:hypothetical protein